jgi:hypothetical protein
MRFHKMLMLAGLAVATVGGAAAADPYHHHGRNQPSVGRYQNGSWEAEVPRRTYGHGSYRHEYRAPRAYVRPSYQSSGYATITPAAPVYYDGYDGYATEPAPGTYQDGYVWVAGTYAWVNGANVWVPAHWQLVDDGSSYLYQPQPAARVIVRPPSWSFSARF